MLVRDVYGRVITTISSVSISYDSESKRPFCGAMLMNEEHCHRCHTLQIKGDVFFPRLFSANRQTLLNGVMLAG